MKPVLFPLLLLFPVAAVSVVSPDQEIADKVPRSLAILNAWQAKDPVASEKKLHLVYWTPSDREPAPAYRLRLSAIMQDIRRFYGKEMVRLGFGPRTFQLDHTKDGQVVVHLVKGAKPYAEYRRESGGEIRGECLSTLQQAGIDPEKETFLIFCNMANWNPAEKKITQNSPYYANGSNVRGTGWQVDSPILNLDYLAKTEPRVQDGQYGDISIGKYNSYFIGGIAHELGHALGLPHNRATPAEEKAFGTALMGGGNRTYGDNLRNEGRGAFLTLAHGLKLASHPFFSNSAKGIDRPADAVPDEVKIENKGGSFTYSAKVVCDPPAYAVIGYMDPKGGGDYDSTTCTAIPDGEGRFTLNADSLVPGKAGVFRIVVLQSNGAASSFADPNSPYAFPYLVAADGSVDLSCAEAGVLLAPLFKAIANKHPIAIRDEFRRLEKEALPPKVMESAKVLAENITFSPGPSPAEARREPCHLSEAATVSASVGFGSPAFNRLPGPLRLFTCGARLFSRGIYAHAPAGHQWNLAGKWKKLTGVAGIPDDKDGGSCVFAVKADGKEIWRSPKTETGTPREFDLDVTGVTELEFIVEDAGDGGRADWGCWFEPTLTR